MKTLHKFILFGIAGLFLSNILFAQKCKDVKSDKSNIPKSINSGCVPGNGSTYLEINNVRALIHTCGDMWWDLIGTAKYEIPKGSGKTALFAGSLWIGGTDVNGQLKFAAMKFRQNGVDFWPGPLIISGGAQASVTTEICAAYDRHFIVSKAEVAQFRSWYNSSPEEQAANFPDYQIPDIITNWPAHGPAGGYDNYLAPFFDNNHDGSYNPADGDYPYFDLDNSLPCGTTRETRVPHLYGDQTLWWVFNDMGNLHTETDGTAIGLEIRAQAYAFATNDELNNMTFYNYCLINRSTATLFETYIGVWTDADLGDAADDYIGCDVSRGLGYIYNGYSIDGTGQPQAYGGPTPPPPAIGIDFFEGPYQDNDGEDNLSSWDNNDSLNCINGYRINRITGVKTLIGPGDILNGNINGHNFGDSIVDNERWGLRNFIYYNCSGGSTGNPNTPLQHYQFLKGYWKDGTHLIFGGTGYSLNGTNADFMFPAHSDPCNWGTAGIIPPAVTNPLLGWCEKGENNPPGDRMFLQSSGSFTLEPGAVNDFTTGAVWVRATTGDEYESVIQMQLADDKAQKFFDNCFKVLNGPDAPELNIIAQDQKLIFHIYNLPGSNNYLEQYNQKDPLIICPAGSGNCDKNYRFQGYQVFQLANQFVTASDLHDDSKARLVFQCDITDQVKKLVNYTWSDVMEANIPYLEVNGNNNGISHSFALTDDAFSTGDGKIVNNKKYFYIVIAYAYNDFLHYNQNDPATISGQKKPYLPSSKSYNFNGIKIYGLGNDSIIPYNDTISNNLTSFNYAEGFEITQVEGHGNGNNRLELTDGTIAEIMAGAPWKALHPTYKAGMGPVKVKIIDPLNIPAEQYTLKFDPNSLSNTEWFNTIGDPSYGLIKSADWFIYNSTFDTIWSDQCIVHNDEKIIPGWGISITVQQVAFPLQAPFSLWADIKGHYPNYGYVQPADSLLGPLVNNGVIESSIENSDNSQQWLYFLPDQDGETQLNWIRSGTVKDFTLPAPDPIWDDFFCDNVLDFTGTPVSVPWDADEEYENIIGGGWAPYFLCQRTANSAGPGWDKTVDIQSIHIKKNSGVMETGLTSVDIVITPDKTKWSRCPVIELCNDTNLAIGNAQQFTLRKSYSIDKNGNASNVDVDGNNPDDANYIGAKGMGWFPGYAIDTETGERLNIIYGEDSWFPGDNGADMIWNPSANIWSFLGDPVFGGKHYIYVMGNPVNYKPRTSGMGTIPTVTDTLIFLPDPNDATKKWYLKNYDEGKFIYEYLKKYPKVIYPYTTGNKLKPGPVKIMSTAMWVGIPMSTGLPLNDNTIPLTEIKVKIRIAKPYSKGYKAYAIDSALAQNNNFPMYTFGTANHRAPVANFSASATTLILCGNVNFFDNSQNSRNSWKWTFTGANPSSSTLQNPTNIYYSTLGIYDVKLVVHGAYSSDSITKIGYITVSPTSIEETVHSKSISIFPNPTDGKFMISYHGSGTEQIGISIYNSIGEIVTKTEIYGRDNLTKQINLNTQSGGIYYIRIDTKKGSIYKKIIKN